MWLFGFDFRKVEGGSSASLTKKQSKEFGNPTPNFGLYKRHVTVRGSMFFFCFRGWACQNLECCQGPSISLSYYGYTVRNRVFPCYANLIEAPYSQAQKSSCY